MAVGIRFLDNSPILTRPIDLTGSNLLFKLTAINEWSEEEIYQRFRQPRRDRILSISGSEPGNSAPRYLVGSAGPVNPQFLTEDILLVDFGEAFPFGQPPAKEDIGIPFYYCAPEVIFESKVSVYSEIWALGCVLFEIRAGQELFSSWMGGQDEILRQIVQTFGRLPEKWWSAWDKKTDFFDEDGKPKKSWLNGIPLAVEYPIEEVIAEIGSEDDGDEHRDSESMLEPCGTRVPGEEAVKLQSLLKGTMSWVPEQRLPIGEILKHPWLSI